MRRKNLVEWKGVRVEELLWGRAKLFCTWHLKGNVGGGRQPSALGCETKICMGGGRGGEGSRVRREKMELRRGKPKSIQIKTSGKRHV